MRSFVVASCLASLGVGQDLFLGRPMAAQYDLVLLPAESGALCLDGSPGGYYRSTGTGSNASRFIIHLEGGAWCLNEEDCLKRSQGSLGSSVKWARSLPGLPGMDGGANGLFSSDPATNPDFHDWTKVHLNYCDGASYSGDRTEAYNTTSGETLFFRGRRILDAMLDSLLEQGLASATHLILNGCSAGGLGVYLHTDYVRHRLPRSIDLVALGDAGMFLDMPTWTGQPGYQAYFRDIAVLQNASALNDGCLAQYSAEPSRCFFAPYTLPHIQTPLFIVQALYDSWQLPHVAGVPCAGDACTNATEHEAFLNFAVEMKAVLGSAPRGAGVFATPCHIHGQVDLNKYWTGLMVNGTSMRDAFGQWWRSRSALNLIDERPYGSNACR